MKVVIDRDALERGITRDGEDVDVDTPDAVRAAAARVGARDDDDDDDDDGDDACARVARAHGATRGDADRDGGVHDDATSLRF